MAIPHGRFSVQVVNTFKILNNFMAEEVVIKKGLLQKVGHSSTLFWHTRWFVLYGGTDKTPPRLTYAKKENVSFSPLPPPFFLELHFPLS